jgi:hypothetical protein
MDRASTGEDRYVQAFGHLEVTARLTQRPEEFPAPGAYRYTYVMPYEVLRVHRQAPDSEFSVSPGDEIFVGHYRPHLPRSEIKDRNWGPSPLGGNLLRFATGEVHRMALDYPLDRLAPGGVLDYCYPPESNRYFAIWTNSTDL